MLQEISPDLKSNRNPVTVEEVNRILEVGKLLLSVLTAEELESLRDLDSSEMVRVSEVSQVSIRETGNAGVT